MRENIEIKRDLHNIYAPIDLSFETLQKMRYATYLAKCFAAKVTIAGVYYPNNAHQGADGLVLPRGKQSAAERRDTVGQWRYAVREDEILPEYLHR